MQLSIRTAISWLIIALAVGLLLHTRQSADESKMLPEVGSFAVDFQLRLLGRYAIGVKSIAPEPQKQRLAEAMLAQLKGTARTKADRIRASIVAAELKGSSAALDLLERIEAKSDDPLRGDVLALRQIWAHSNIHEANLDPEARQQLLDRHEWFGRLALSWGLPDSDQERRAAIEPAIRTAATAMSLFVGAAGLGICGLILLIIAIILYATGVLRPAFSPPARRTGVYLEVFAIYLAWYIGGSMLAGYSGDRRIFLAAACAPLAALWPLLCGSRWSELRRDLGWHVGRGLGREIGSGIVAYIAGLPILFLGLYITLWISRYSGAQPTHPIVRQISFDPVKVLKLLLLASVYAPLVEETMFRGALFAHLRRRFAWPIAAIIVAFIFAAIHPQGFAAVPALMSLAFTFAAMREWRGSLIAPITAHALNNGVLVLALVLMAG